MYFYVVLSNVVSISWYFELFVICYNFMLFCCDFV